MSKITPLIPALGLRAVFIDTRGTIHRFPVAFWGMVEPDTPGVTGEPFLSAMLLVYGNTSPVPMCEVDVGFEFRTYEQVSA